jgi:plasmid maintenance system antidote protein VapI
MDSTFKDIEMQLREAILNSGMSCYEIAKQAGVTNSQLSLFLSSRRSLTLTSAAKIARVLGLELRPTKTKHGSTRKTR